jgi:hypothetical protein
MNFRDGIKLSLRRASQAWGLVDDFRRGYRYGRTLSNEMAAVGTSVPNDLERYFNSHVSGRGIWKWRHYFDVYDRHLSKFRGQEVHILEVGIYSGGSLGMWRSYFGSKACVYGVDIEPACRAYEEDGINVFIGDQADRAFWDTFKRAVPRLDVVIDDGGHQAVQQIPTLESLLPHLQPGGVYICEDLHGRFHQFSSYVDGLARNLHAFDLTDASVNLRAISHDFQRLVSSVHSYPFVSVVERRANALDYFEAPKHGTEWAPFLKTQLPWC